MVVVLHLLTTGKGHRWKGNEVGEECPIKPMCELSHRTPINFIIWHHSICAWRRHGWKNIACSIYIKENNGVYPKHVKISNGGDPFINSIANWAYHQKAHRLLSLTH